MHGVNRLPEYFILRQRLLVHSNNATSYHAVMIYCAFLPLNETGESSISAAQTAATSGPKLFTRRTDSRHIRSLGRGGGHIGLSSFPCLNWEYNPSWSDLIPSFAISHPQIT